MCPDERQLEESLSACMVVTDLSKAFDSINHSALLYKLEEANTESNLIKIIGSYL